MENKISKDDLLLMLGHYDGENGRLILQWLVNLGCSTIAHGWALAAAMYRVSDNMARAEKILRALTDHGFITRLKIDLLYAPEIRFFGVGGFSGANVEKSDSSLLYTYAPTDLLLSMIRANMKT